MKTLLLTIILSASVGIADPVRSLKVVVSRDASPEVKQAAASIVAATTQPLIKALAEGRQIETSESEKLLDSKIEDRAYSHLIVVGLMNDPAVQRVWQHEARRIDGGIYVFGFGYFSGDIGYIESDRNPFLHSAEIKVAPFETEIVTITGASPAGVVAAAKAFAEQGLINGVVAGHGWKRASPGLLDRDPLAKDFFVPSLLPLQVGNATRVGITQASEDEYRGVLQDAGIKPLEVWRAKYYMPGAWDGSGWQSAMKAYHAGLHRRATGNTLWAARFASEDQAKQAAPKIAAAAQLQAKGDRFVGKQPPFTTNDSPGSLTLWRQDEWMLMSTLPAR